jgi:hypothetical protein
MAKLKAQYPGRSFAVYAGGPDHVAFNADFPGVKVESIDFATAGSRIQATVNMFNPGGEPCAPQVDVSLFGRDEKLIASGNIVGHTQRDLYPNARKSTADSLFVPEGADVAVVAINGACH